MYQDLGGKKMNILGPTSQLNPNTLKKKKVPEGSQKQEQPTPPILAQKGRNVVSLENSVFAIHPFSLRPQRFTKVW